MSRQRQLTESLERRNEGDNIYIYIYIYMNWGGGIYTYVYVSIYSMHMHSVYTPYIRIRDSSVCGAGKQRLAAQNKRICCYSGSNRGCSNNRCCRHIRSRTMKARALPGFDVAVTQPHNYRIDFLTTSRCFAFATIISRYLCIYYGWGPLLQMFRASGEIPLCSATSTLLYAYCI